MEPRAVAVDLPGQTLVIPGFRQIDIAPARADSSTRREHDDHYDVRLQPAGSDDAQFRYAAELPPNSPNDSTRTAMPVGGEIGQLVGAGHGRRTRQGRDRVAPASGGAPSGSTVGSGAASAPVSVPLIASTGLHAEHGER